MVLIFTFDVQEKILTRDLLGLNYFYDFSSYSFILHNWYEGNSSTAPFRWKMQDESYTELQLPLQNVSNSLYKSSYYFQFFFFLKTHPFSWTSLVAQTVKGLPTMQETRFQSLGREDPLGKEMETHCSILAWKIPWTEEPGRLQSMGSQKVGQTVFIRTFTVFSFSFFLNTSFFLEKTFTNKWISSWRLPQTAVIISKRCQHDLYCFTQILIQPTAWLVSTFLTRTWALIWGTNSQMLVYGRIWGTIKILIVISFSHSNTWGGVHEPALIINIWDDLNAEFLQTRLTNAHLKIQK